MPLTLVELYRVEMDPVCPNKELSPAPSPARFCISVHSTIKVSPPFPVLGWLRFGGNSDGFAPAGAALLQHSISSGPSCVCPAELLCPGSFARACPCCLVTATWGGWQQSSSLSCYLPALLQCWTILWPKKELLVLRREPLLSQLASLCLLHQCCFVLCGY